MLTPADCFAIFGISLLSSAHCAGMCGGFAIALGRGVEGRRALAVRQWVYSVGRVTTYLALGMLAGMFGLAVVRLPAMRVGAVVLSVAAGLSMIGLGLHQLGVTRRFDWHARLAPPKALAAAMGRVLELRDPIVPYALGLLNGLLPCGLVVSWLLQAATTGSPFEGLVTMAIFGLGTIPMMFLMGFMPGFLTPSWRGRLARVGAVALIGFGLYQCTLRALPGAHAHGAHGGGGAHAAHEAEAATTGESAAEAADLMPTVHAHHQD